MNDFSPREHQLPWLPIGIAISVLTIFVIVLVSVVAVTISGTISDCLFATPSATGSSKILSETLGDRFLVVTARGLVTCTGSKHELGGPLWQVHGTGPERLLIPSLNGLFPTEPKM